MSDNRKHSAGKGDYPRKVNQTKYGKNHDEISWPSKKKVDKSIKTKYDR